MIPRSMKKVQQLCRQKRRAQKTSTYALENARLLRYWDRVLLLQSKQEIQGILGFWLGNEEVAEPCWKPVLRTNDFSPRLHKRLGPDHIGAPLHGLEAAQAACCARVWRVHIAVSHCREGLLRHRRPCRDAESCEQGFFDQVHAPRPQVALVDLASAHSCVDLNELGSGARHLALD